MCWLGFTVSGLQFGTLANKQFIDHDLKLENE